MARRPPSRAKQRPWVPMERGEPNPAYLAAVYPDGIAAAGIARVEVYDNDLYQATVEHYGDGTARISFKRHDRAAVRDWRHFQAIKNECVGAEREAVELFPAESRLLDEANQYHLWVAPEGVQLPIGQTFRSVATAAEIAANDANGGRGRQRDVQPGLPTGTNLDLPSRPSAR